MFFVEIGTKSSQFKEIALFVLLKEVRPTNEVEVNL